MTASALKTCRYRPLAAGVLVVGCAVVLAWTHAPRGRSTEGTPAAVQAMAAQDGNRHPASTPQALARPATMVEPVSCEKLPDVPGKMVTTARVHFPPHAFSGAHRHPGSVLAFVVRGSVRSQLAGSAAATYHAGQTWFEPRGALHLLAENPSSEPAELLAVFITDEDCGPLVVPEP